jgi:type I restriction enzyme S subunit
MKDSGIEWIGAIPEGWTKEKTVRVFQTIGSGTTPKSNNESYYEGNCHWIQSGDINGGIITDSKASVSDEALKVFSALKVYSAPFLIIAMYGASIGNLSFSVIDGCVNQACCVLKDTIQNLRYCFYTLKTAQSYLIWKAVGGGQHNISQETIKQLWLPIPPVSEQCEIAAYLDNKCAEIDSIIDSKQQFLTKLESYKKSMIYECVTGKREV